MKESSDLKKMLVCTPALSQEDRKPLFPGHGEMLFLASKHFLGLTLSAVLASRDL